MKKIIDVSYANGIINWEKAKNSIDGAIIRCGFGMNQKSQDDVQYIRNVEECIRLGIPFGIYLYSYANTIEKANSEAEHVLRLINNYKDKIKLHIWYDIEDKIQANLDKNVLSNIITTFCNKVENSGFSVGIYANNNWLRNRIDDNIKNRYMIWSAGYGNNDGQAHEEAKYNHNNVVCWQFTSNGNIEGVGRCDINYYYKDIENVSNNIVETTNIYTYKDFVGDVQKAIEAKVDRIAGTETLSKTVTVSRYKNRTHAVVKPIQKYMYVLGYTEIGKDDGIAGIKFETAVNRYQREVLHYSRVDGEITARNNMWKSLFKLI